MIEKIFTRPLSRSRRGGGRKRNQTGFLKLLIFTMYEDVVHCTISKVFGGGVQLMASGLFNFGVGFLYKVIDYRPIE